MATSHSSGTRGKHRRRHRRAGAVVAAAAVVTGLAVAATLVVGSRDNPGDQASDGAQAATASGAGDASGSATASTTPGPSPTAPSSTAAAQLEVALERPTASPMEAVRVTGRLAGAPPGTAVTVQLLQRGRWLDFPLQPELDDTGAFRTYVEVGPVGRHQLRVVEPRSGSISERLFLRVR